MEISKFTQYVNRLLVLVLTQITIISTLPSYATANDWNILVTLHEAKSISNDDGWGDDDLYWAVYPSPGGSPCVNEDQYIDGQTHIKPNWHCVIAANGTDPTISLKIQLNEYDSGFNFGDDTLDIHPATGFKDIVVSFKPASQSIMIPGIEGWQEQMQCATGHINVGAGSDGDDYGQITFSVSASKGNLPIAAIGDSDLDGLQDSWEICGLPGIDLAGMGADPLQKDLFIELDWFVDDDGIGLTDHSHEPWLPALVNGWNEFANASVTNPLRSDGTRAAGIALHVDTGSLYESYGLDFDGDGAADVNLDVDGDGINESIDLDFDGTADIGRIGQHGSGTRGGGNRICADFSHAPCTTVAQAGESTELSKIQAVTIRQNNFVEARAPVFRYGVFGHRFGGCDTSSGGTGVGNNHDINIAIMLARAHNCTSGWGQQAIFVGPSGLNTDGTIHEHTGTWLHELGHSIGLKHGGRDDDNYKPNYISIMNYRFQMDGIQFDYDGDGLVDTVTGTDYDQNGVWDDRRYKYGERLNRLDEDSLMESSGVGGNYQMTSHNCPPNVGGTSTARAAGPIDWDCDGTTDTAAVKVDVNGDGTKTVLNSADDYSLLSNSALRGLNKQEYDELRKDVNKTLQVDTEKFITNTCGAMLFRVDFEEFTSGTILSSQYNDRLQIPVHFLRDSRRNPMVMDDVARSATQSLLNRKTSNGAAAPLELEFVEPQRLVGFYLGSDTALDPNDVTVTLTAYGADGAILGEVRRLGVPLQFNGFMGIAAVYPSEMIASVVLEYRAGEELLPVRIDDLLFCSIVHNVPGQQSAPVTDRVLIEVASQRLEKRGEGSEAQGTANPRFVRLGMPPVSIVVNGQKELTDFEIEISQGDTAILVAPASALGLNFGHWEITGGNVESRLPNGQTQIEYIPMIPTKFVAVYRNP